MQEFKLIQCHVLETSVRLDGQWFSGVGPVERLGPELIVALDVLHDLANVLPFRTPYAVFQHVSGENIEPDFGLVLL